MKKSAKCLMSFVTITSALLLFVSVFAACAMLPGGDIYMTRAGYEKNSSDVQVAILWKNGVAQYLSDGKREAQAKSVYVSDGDVYVAGSEKNSSDVGVAILWKNGIAQYLSDGKPHLVHRGNPEPVAPNGGGALTVC